MSEQTNSRPDRKAYAIRDFIESYGVSRSYVYELFNRGDLEYVKVGKRTLIPVESAERWFNSLSN